MKELRDISWQVDEPTYRADFALSYSTIARYERGGFGSLPTLFDEQSSPSLTFGSMVDELITGNEESFNKRFIVAEFPKLEPSVETVVKYLYANNGRETRNLFDIDADTLKDAMDACEFRTTWTALKRSEKILTKQSADYYRLLGLQVNKVLVPNTMYNDAVACVNALKSSPQTFHYFRDNSPDGDIKRYYQLKFKATIDGVDYRCMADLLIVDYKNKVIIPCDLKTSSSQERDFGYSVKKWRYDLQARLYWRIIRINLDADPYFRYFWLRDFIFIVVNKDSLTPLLWRFPKVHEEGEITIGNMTCRAPWTIGKELRGYLDTNPKVPNDIKLTGVNDVCAWLDRHAV